MAEQRRKGGEHRMFRALFSVDEKLWERFGELAGKTRRAEVLRSFVAWYTRQPGAKLPRRPPQE